MEKKPAVKNYLLLDEIRREREREEIKNGITAIPIYINTRLSNNP